MSAQGSDPVFSTPLNVSVNMVNGTNIIQVNIICNVYCPVFINMQYSSCIVMDNNAENVFLWHIYCFSLYTVWYVDYIV